MKPASRIFHATLERIDSPLKWVMVRIPFDTVKAWGKRGQLKVQGEINGYGFRTSLFPDGRGGHRLLVNKAMQRGAKSAPGMSARFRLEPDAAARVVTVPRELDRALSESRALRRWFDGLSYSVRNELCKVVTRSANRAARVRRAGRVAECLLSAREAERELPPAFEIALSRNSRAREGWRLMSPLRRRGHLLGIFYYQSPNAREQRMAKAVEDAVQLAENRNRRT